MTLTVAMERVAERRAKRVVERPGHIGHALVRAWFALMAAWTVATGFFVRMGFFVPNQIRYSMAIVAAAMCLWACIVASERSVTWAFFAVFPYAIFHLIRVQWVATRWQGQVVNSFHYAVIGSAVATIASLVVLSGDFPSAGRRSVSDHGES